MNYKQYYRIVILFALVVSFKTKGQNIQEPYWDILDNIEYNNGVLKPVEGMTSSDWVRAGSRSKLEADEEGYVIVETLGVLGDQYIGFSEVPFQYRNQESKYALRFTSWGQVYMYVNGVSLGKIFPTTGSDMFLENYQFKLSKESDGIRVYVREEPTDSYAMIKELLISPTEHMPMWVCSYMKGDAKGFHNMISNMPDEQHPIFWNPRETAGHMKYDRNDANNYGIAESDSDWKGGGILSEQELTSGERGAIRYIPIQSESTAYRIGFSSAKGLDRAEQLDYAYEFLPDGTLKIFCNNELKHQTVFTVSGNQELKIVLHNGNVYFYSNDSLLYDQSISNQALDFRVGLLFGEVSQRFRTITSSLLLPIPKWDYLDEVNITGNGLNVFKTNPTSAWNSGIASTAIGMAREKEIYLEAVNADRFYKFVGIPKDYTDMNSISDFHYGFLTNPDGNKVTIYRSDENNVTTSTLFNIADPDGDGNSVTNSSYYIYGNKMGIRVSDSKIFFYYNNVMVHHENFQVNDPIHFGAMLYEENSSFKLLRYGVEETFEQHKNPNWAYARGLERYQNSGFKKEPGAAEGLKESIAVSENTFSGDKITEVFFSGVEGNGIKRFGFTDQMYPDTSGPQKYYFEVDNNQELHLYHYNDVTLNLGVISNTDVLSVENKNDALYFKKNGRYLGIGGYNSSYDMHLFVEIEKADAKIASISTSANGLEEVLSWNNNNDYQYNTTTELLTNTGWTSGGLSSHRILAEQVSALLSWTNSASYEDYYAGFSRKKKPNSLEDLDFSYKVHNNGTLEVYEYGVLVSTITGAGSSVNGFLGVERRNDRILYLWNDIIVYESDVLSTDKLYPAVYATELLQSLPQLSFSLNESPAKWIDKTNVLYDANFKNMLCTSTTSSWDASAISGNRLKTGETSYVNFRVGSQLGKEKAIALTAAADEATASGLEPKDQDYALWFDGASADVRIFENGTEYTGSYGSYDEGDLFSIEKIDIGSGNYAIKYMMNDVLLRQVTIASDIDLLAIAQCKGEDAALYDINIGFENISLPSAGSNPYVIMARTPTAKYQKSEGQLLLKLDDNFVYENSDELSYKVYNAGRQELFCYGAPDLDNLGGRRFVLDTSSFCTGSEGLENGKYYTLEVTNKKNERRYMRFKYVIPI